MIAATAPCFWANKALSDTLQLPRWMSATLPAVAAGKAASAQPMPPASVGRISGTSRSPLAASVGDQDWCTALGIGPPTLGSMTHCRSSGSAVCATLMTPSADDGEPTMNGRSAEFPAEATTTTPACTRLSEAKDESSSSWPYDEPSDMFTMSTASEMSPSPLGSSDQSRPCSMATPLHEVDTAEQTVSA